MKRSSYIVLAVAITLMAPLSAFAGPFQSKFIQGTATGIDFALNVPAGKTVTVLNFFHWSSGSFSGLWVRIGSSNNPYVWAMQADYPNSPLNNKDLTIDGPAQIAVTVPEGDVCILSYKLFIN
jgi:hypothetical protein